MPKTTKKFVIIDGNALLHRAWHALPPLSTSDGAMVNAVYGFASIMLNIIKELEPTHGAVAFDPPGGTFRHEKYEAYKATREKQPDELYEQIPMIKEVARDFGFHIEEQAGFEADDVIGTLAAKAAKKGFKTVIVTGDMDALQLVDKNTVVYTIKRGIKDTITYDIAAVKEKHGFGPEKVIEYKALAGDSSDNIPGVSGIGDKSAKLLLEQFDTIEDMYAYLKKGGGEKIKESFAKKLIEHKKEAELSKELATIDCDMNIAFDENDLEVQPAHKEALFELFRKLEFRSLVSRAHEVLGGYEPKAAPGDQSSLFDSANVPDDEFEIRDGYCLVDSKKRFDAFYKKIAREKAFVFDTETDALGSLTANLLGASFSWKEGEAYYVTAPYVAGLRDLFSNPDIKKYGHNVKYDIQVIEQAGMPVKGVVFDTMIASYILHPAGRSHSLDNSTFIECRHEMVPIESLIGKRGKKQRSLADVNLRRVADYAAEDADYTMRLVQIFRKKLHDEKLESIFGDIEMPLVPVLSDMETAGVKIDVVFLENMSRSVGKTLTALEKNIYKQAGGEFNVNSPIQLKEVLFEKLKLSTEGIGKTKTGYSTAADELEKLADKHEIIPLIMEQRELSKLKNTYLDALPKLVNKKTGRVHTHYNQTIASTGRLSSSDPNLQNIPIRTELGRKIRKAFVAEPGHVLISADYSQIELRIAADLSGDKKLIQIFKDGLDVHTSTAAFIHNIPEEKVTPEIRRTAKEINFGVLYGMGSHGLSQRAGLSFKEAREFIDRYFGTFAQVKDYIEKNIERAKDRGFVETRFGRRLSIPDIHSGVQQVRAAAERLATNMPIQGTAADIIKLAMIKIAEELPKVSRDARMIMQVHDELVFEVLEQDAKRVSDFVSRAMESVVELRVPIVVEAKTGKNWEEAH